MTDPLDAVSLGLALMLGTAGLPHILMRFYTVPDARTARTSVGYATAFIGFFYLLTFMLGFGAMVIIGREAITAVDAGGNMAAPLLAEGVGGTPFLGFIAAVAFATILAVVAGLTLSGAATLSHDLWVNVVRRGHADEREQLRWRALATVLLAVVSIVLGIMFKGQNVAYMVGLAFAIAASANFPALVLSIFWSRLTTPGAQASMIVGTVSTLALIWLSPTIQIDILNSASGLVSAAESGHRDDSAVVRRGDWCLAAASGAGRGAAIRRARAATAPRCRVAVGRSRASRVPVLLAFFAVGARRRRGCRGRRFLFVGRAPHFRRPVRTPTKRSPAHSIAAWPRSRSVCSTTPARVHDADDARAARSRRRG